MSVRISIKSPSQQVKDFGVDCDLSWTVGNLKEHLSVVYPTKPMKSQQKIIYSGRLLPDHLQLKDIMTQDHGTYTVHLVCPHLAGTSKDESAESVSTDSQAKEVNTGPGVPYANVIPTALHADGLRQRFMDPQSYVPTPSNIYPFQMPPVPDSAAGVSPYMAYQLAMMQQTYAQAMAQYWAQSNSGYHNSSYMAQQGAGTASTTRTSAEQPRIPNANELQRMQNGGEEGIRERDFLDSVYVFSRIIMLCTVLYFYSSPGRVILVLSLAFVFIMYRIGARRRARRLQRTSPPVERRAHDQSPADENVQRTTEDDNTEAEGTNEETNVQQSDVETSSNESSHQPSSSALQVAVTFVKTFFTSLVPEQPLPVELN